MLGAMSHGLGEMEERPYLTDACLPVELASVPRRGLPFLLLKLLVLEIGPGLSKANFFPDLITAPLNHTNIRLEFLLE